MTQFVVQCVVHTVYCASHLCITLQFEIITHKSSVCTSKLCLCTANKKASVLCLIGVGMDSLGGISLMMTPRPRQSVYSVGTDEVFKLIRWRQQQSRAVCGSLLIEALVMVRPNAVVLSLAIVPMWRASILIGPCRTCIYWKFIAVKLRFVFKLRLPCHGVISKWNILITFKCRFCVHHIIVIVSIESEPINFYVHQ